MLVICHCGYAVYSNTIISVKSRQFYLPLCRPQCRIRCIRFRDITIAASPSLLRPTMEIQLRYRGARNTRMELRFYCIAYRVPGHEFKLSSVARRSSTRLSSLHTDLRFDCTKHFAAPNYGPRKFARTFHTTASNHNPFHYTLCVA